jgi:pseudouridine-5'-phosphate glycosidase
MQAKWAMSLGGGIILANPIPEDAEIPASEIEPAIAAAVALAERRGIGGKALTPFLLSEIAAATGGRSLEANIALVKNNAHVAARIAAAFAEVSK